MFAKHNLAATKSVKVVKAKGFATALVQMESWGAAQQAFTTLNKSSEAMLADKLVQVTWAPISTDEALEQKWKSHWNTSLGCAFIPADSIDATTAPEAFEKWTKDGTIDAESVPEEFKNLLPSKPPSTEDAATTEGKYAPVRKDYITGIMKHFKNSFAD